MKTSNRQRISVPGGQQKQHHRFNISDGFAPRLFGPEGRKKKPTTRASNPPTSPRVRPIKFRKQRPPDALRLYDDYHTVTSRNRTEVLVSRNRKVEEITMLKMLFWSGQLVNAIARGKTVLYQSFSTTYRRYSAGRPRRSLHTIYRLGHASGGVFLLFPVKECMHACV